MKGLCLEGFEDLTKLLRSGVYILLFRGEIIYVGQSKSLYARIYAHRNLSRSKKVAPAWLKAKGINFDQVLVRYCPVHELDFLEASLIEIYKPRLNVRLQKELCLLPVELRPGIFLNATKAPPASGSGLRRL